VKITAVKTYGIAAGPHRNWVLVRILTDEGLEGVGEASLEGKTDTIVAAVGELARYLVGQDPLRIEHHWQTMYRGAFWRGGPILNSAISGVEIALWDILGKVAGLPVYQLLGGACRDRILAYTHVGGATAEETVARALAYKVQGWRALKTSPLVESPEGVLDSRSIARGVEHVGALRQALGDDYLILLDAHGRMEPVTAIEVGRAMEPFKPYFYEEPVPPENPVAMARVAAKVGVPLATGERLYTKWGFREILEKGIVEYIQPDPCHCGGILETRSIAAMAETHGVQVAPHNPLSPVATAVSLHLAACIPNFAIQEIAQGDVSWRDELLTEPITVRDGYFALPKGPGLGIEVNWETVRAHPAVTQDVPRLRHEDGSMAHW
jgi:galactonate dehydratase